MRNKIAARARKCRHFLTELFNCLMGACLLFRSFIIITSRIMASKATRIKILALETAGISNRVITKQLHMRLCMCMLARYRALSKIFIAEAVTNTQIDRLYARVAGDLPKGSRTHTV